MINEIKDDASDRMLKTIESFKKELAKVRAGRAHPSILDNVVVSYYGTATPLKQTANVVIEDARTLSVTPWEKNIVPDIEKAIINAGLGLNPVTSGSNIRIPIPPLTEERRKDLTKVVRTEAEKTKVAIRNIRRDANSDVKELLKEKEISEDDERKSQDLIQKITDTQVKTVDEILAKKEKDLLEI
jgi:ribosome recycling factor